MKAIKLRTWLIGLAMILAAVAALLLKPSSKVADRAPQFQLESAIPKSFGDWQVNSSVSPVIPSPDTKANLDQLYDQLISRSYINSNGQMVMLVVAYGSVQNQKLRTHRQEVCYRAQGFNIESVRAENISVIGKSVLATHMYATMGRRKEPVTYWFTMGDEVVMSYFSRQLVQLKYALTGYIPDGFLVRISSLSAEPNAAFLTQTEFANELIKVIDPVLATRIVGKGN